MENETDEVVSGVSTLSMAVDQAGPLSFADVLDLGAEVAGALADDHADGTAHGHVAPASVVRLDDGPWRLAPAALIPDIEPVPAPELDADGPATPAGDVYALGATLTFALTGTVVDPVTTNGSPADPSDAAFAAGDGDTDADAEIADVDDLAGGPTPADGTDAADGTDIDEPGAGEAVIGADADATEAVAVGDAAIDLTEDPSATALTLPEVMTSFLGALRSSLAVDPDDRPAASDLAATLRQLRTDADSALGGALVAGAVTAVAIGDGAAAEPWGAPLYDTEAADVSTLPAPPSSDATAAAAAGAAAAVLAVEGTGSAASIGVVDKKKTKKSLKERAPLLVAAAAVLIAVVLGVSLVRERNDKTSDLLAVGPTVGTTVRRTTTTLPAVVPVEVIVETTTTLASTTTTSTSTTVPQVVETVPETTVPETTVPTTAPTTTEPTTTVPPTTTTTTPTIAFKQAKVACVTPPNAGNPCALFAQPDATSPQQGAVLPNGTLLQATCIKTGVAPPGSPVDTWLYIIGPAPTYAGWLSATHLGGSVPTLPACPATPAP